MTEIIEAALRDIPVIRSLSHKIWPVAFAEILSPAQMDYMLEWMYSPDALKAQINNHHRFLLLKENGKYCGYCAYEQKKEIVKLHKIYLLPEKWGQHLGRILLDEVIARTKKSGRKILQLNVNRHNKAVKFYEKHGFQITKEEDNDIGNGYFMNDYVMEYKI